MLSKVPGKLLDPMLLPRWPSGTSAAPQKNCPSQSTTLPHQSTEMILERASSHIKVTCPLVYSSCRPGKI